MVDLSADAIEGYRARATLPPFRKKVAKALAMVENTYQEGKSYVSVSWGKDSTALYHLCQQVAPEILGISYLSVEYKLTGDYDTVIANYLAKFGGNYYSEFANEGAASTSTSTRHRVCRQLSLEEQQIGYIGLRAEESRNRRIVLATKGDIYTYTSGDFKGSTRVCPLAWWTTDDVWTYLVSREIPFVNAYNYEERTNCHAKFWHNEFKGTRVQRNALANIKRHNLPLYTYLKQEIPDIDIS